jgi:hypothetical protein
MGQSGNGAFRHGNRGHPEIRPPGMLSIFPGLVVPPALQDGNPLGLLRLIDGTHTREAVHSAPAKNFRESPTHVPANLDAREGGLECPALVARLMRHNPEVL